MASADALVVDTTAFMTKHFGRFTGLLRKLLQVKHCRNRAALSSLNIDPKELAEFQY